MQDLANYLERAKRILRCDEPLVEEKPFGLIVNKGNWTPSEGMRVPIEIYGPAGDSVLLDHGGLTIHERMLILADETPIRSHQETQCEIIRNDGDIDVEQVMPDRVRIRKGHVIYSVLGRSGYEHGLNPLPVAAEKVGLLYVIKALRPGFAEGRSFRMPPNTYTP